MRHRYAMVPLRIHDEVRDAEELGSNVPMLVVRRVFVHWVRLRSRRSRSDWREASD